MSRDNEQCDPLRPDQHAGKSANQCRATNDKLDDNSVDIVGVHSSILCTPTIRKPLQMLDSIQPDNAGQKSDSGEVGSSLGSRIAAGIRREKKLRREKEVAWHNFHVVQKMREKRDRAKRKGKYGLSVNDREFMLDLQNNRCAICRKRFNANRVPCVDHCHRTGRVREFLCFKCNAGIGLLGDDVDVILRAFEYLHRHNAPSTKKTNK